VPQSGSTDSRDRALKLRVQALPLPLADRICDLAMWYVNSVLPRPLGPARSLSPAFPSESCGKATTPILVFQSDWVVWARSKLWGKD